MVMSSKLGYVITVLILTSIVMTSVATATTQSQVMGGRFWWLYKGLRVAYFGLALQTSQSPGAPYVPGSERELSTTSKSGAINWITTYVVTDVDGEGVRIKYVSFSIMIEKNLVMSDEYKVAYLRNKPFDGPFWIDPARVANVRVGDTVTLGPPGKERAYKVAYVGRLDLSPFSEGSDSLKQLIKYALAIPLPKGTYRDIVILNLITQKGKEGREYHTLVIDKVTGLIIAQMLSGFSSSIKGELGVTVESSSVVLVLAEVTLDLESKLPPYSSYDYGPYLHTGYGYVISGSIGLDYLVMLRSLITGVYKDRVIIIENCWASRSGGTAASEVDVFLLNLKTYEGKVIYSKSALGAPLRGLSDTYKLLPMYIGKYVNEDTVEIMGVTYESSGYTSVNTDNGVVKLKVFTARGNLGTFGLAKLYYLSNGLLVLAIPAINGYPIREVLMAKSSSEYLKELPYYKPLLVKPTVTTSVGTVTEGEVSKARATTTTANTVANSVTSKSVTKSVTSMVRTTTSIKTSSVTTFKTPIKTKNTKTTKAVVITKVTTLTTSSTTSTTSKVSKSVSVTSTYLRSTSTKALSSKEGSQGGVTKGGVPVIINYLVVAVVAATIASVVTLIARRRR